VWSSFELRVYDEVLNGYCVDRDCFLEGVAVFSHHILENSIHILSQEVLVIFLKVEGGFFLFFVHLVELFFDLSH